MVKNICLLFLVFIASSCSVFSDQSATKQAEDSCPNIIIPRDIAYVIQKVGYMDDFQIELKGYQGFCYMDTRVNRRKAVITPEFEVRRLRKNLDETDIDFTFFTETKKGPPAYLGKKTYNQSVSLPQAEQTKTFTGKTVEVKVPNEGYADFEVYLGIDLTPQEKKYNDRIFDINFKYEEDY